MRSLPRCQSAELAGRPGGRNSICLTLHARCSIIFQCPGRMVRIGYEGKCRSHGTAADILPRVGRGLGSERSSGRFTLQATSVLRFADTDTLAGNQVSDFTILQRTSHRLVSLAVTALDGFLCKPTPKRTDFPNTLMNLQPSKCTFDDGHIQPRKA